LFDLIVENLNRLIVSAVVPLLDETRNKIFSFGKASLTRLTVKGQVESRTERTGKSGLRVDLADDSWGQA